MNKELYIGVKAVSINGGLVILSEDLFNAPEIFIKKDQVFMFEGVLIPEEINLEGLGIGEAVIPATIVTLKSGNTITIMEPYDSFQERLGLNSTN